MPARNTPPLAPGGSGTLTICPWAPGLLGGAGAGIERHLVGRGEEDAGVVPDEVLGAVAVVHVEIDDRDPLQPVDLEARAGRRSTTVPK